MKKGVIAKVFNDPVYGFITIPSTLILQIVDHPFFQRLRRIKQLGLTHLVYPGAINTRFHHALGAMHLMQEALKILEQKGHDIDPKELSYKSGDSFLSAAQGRTSQSLIALDSTGRTYSVAAHKLPSARGQGEPLTSSVTPPSGATFTAVMMGADADQYFMLSDAGYGFVCSLEDMVTKNKKGKATLSVPKGAQALRPSKVNNLESDAIAVVTTAGYLAIYPITELPVLGKGKGVKLINIPAKLLKSRDETVVGGTVFRKGQHVLIHSGKRYLRLKGQDLDLYRGERGKRGKKLPKGFQAVKAITVEAASATQEDIMLDD